MSNLPVPAPAPQDPRGWHYQIGAQQLGPVPMRALVDMMRNGTVTAATMVWTNGMPQWVAAGSVPELLAGRTAGQKPGKVQALSIIALISGCLNAMWAMYFTVHILFFGLITFGLGCILLVLPLWVAIVAALEINYATKILPTPMKTNRPSQIIPILQMTCALGCNPLALAAGIISLVFTNDPEVKAYFAATQT